MRTFYHLRPHRAPARRLLAFAAGVSLVAWAPAAWAALAPPPGSAGLPWPVLGLAGALALLLILACSGGAPEDQAERERLWSIIQASRNKLKAVFDAISDPICSLTPDFKVESVNMALANMTSRHPRELVGLSGQELMRLAKASPATQQHMLETFNECVARRAPLWRMVQAEVNGGTRYFEVTTTPVQDEAGLLSLVIAQVRDVTVFKRMEQTVREYSHSLESMVAERTKDLSQAQEQLKDEKERLARAHAELLKLERLRQDLTNMVVHDLKGPLAEIMGNLDLVSYDPLTETQREALDLALLGAEDLLRMIMNLLDISRLEEGRLTIKAQPVVFADLALEVLGKFRTVIRLKGLEVHSEDTATPFPADPGLLGRVLQNLLTNALNHTPEGGQVWLRAQDQAEDGVVIQVQDTGDGIPARFRDKVFQKFMQASDSQGPRTSTGLGLTFCKMAVEAHGGRIWVESEVGQGSTFSLWLPRTPPE